MGSKEFELTEELLQRYYDGELDEAASHDVEQALALDAQATATFQDYRAVGRMLRAASQATLPDQLSTARNWETISREISCDPGRPVMRKPAAWLTAVAAAAALVLYFSPLDIVPSAQASNELDIESIDCNYASFMLLQPEAENGHTIIWINDPE